MKKIILFAALFVSLIALAGVAFAAPVCGSTCPAQCAAAGELCVPEERAGSATTVEGKQLSCVKKQNVGCGFKLAWPFIQGNACTAGFTYDVGVDGVEDCGFLGIGAILGGSVKNCHALQDVACSANATCTGGFQTRNSTQCSVEQEGQPTTLQCCEIGGGPIIDIEEPPTNVTNNTNFGQVTQIQIEPANPVLPSGGEVQLIAKGITSVGLAITLEDDLQWNVSNSNIGNLSATGIFSACDNCTGTTTVTLRHGPLTATTTVEVVGLDQYRIEPSNVTIAVGGTAIVKATARNVLTGLRQNVQSTWSVGEDETVEVAYPSGSATSALALIRGVDAGNASLQASIGRLTANVTVLIVPATSFTPSVLEVQPDPIIVPEGQEVQLLITARNAAGVYGPLLGPVVFNESDTDALIATRNGDRIIGVAQGETTINISSGSLFALVEIQVSGCVSGSTMQCSADHAGYTDGAGYQTRSCNADGAWTSCDDTDACDNTPAPQRGLADGVVCTSLGWCTPGLDDPDCACSGSDVQLCTDAATACWGRMACTENVFGPCSPSPSCTGAILSGTIISDSAGLFNGFICAATTPVPSSLTLAAVSSCQAVGSSGAASSIVSGGEGACRTNREVELLINVSADPDAAYNSVFIERTGIPGAKFYLKEVSEGGVMLNINDTSTNDVVPVLLQVGQSINFNARVTLVSVNTTRYYEGEALIGMSGIVNFDFDDCLFNLRAVEEAPAG